MDFSSLLLTLAFVFELIKDSVQQVSFVVSWVFTVKTKIEIDAGELFRDKSFPFASVSTTARLHNWPV